MKSLDIKYLSKIALLGVLLSGCVKEIMEDPTFPPKLEDQRMLFVGDYQVVDIETGDEYNLSIQLPNHSKDSITIVNFGSRFPFFTFRYNLQSFYKNSLDYTTLGVLDESGNRWFISNWGDSTIHYHNNVLLEGKILFHYKISNIAYYDQDSVPFFEGTFRHLATKLN